MKHWALFLPVVLFFGCGNSKDCIPREYVSCTDGVAYWMDSCGNAGEVKEECECGCRTDGTDCKPCTCEPHATTGCYNGDVWWFDSCGELDELITHCENGCQDGACIGCTPDCAGKECGPDGCGGFCGFCDTGLVCQTSTGQCVAECTPDCSGKECGDDGCGGSCGDCLGGSVCQDFTCVCTSHASTGCHQGDVWWFDSCGNPEEIQEECEHGCQGGACGPCVADCTGKDCGDDGCGGSCGDCDPGMTCDPDGQCVPACDLPAITSDQTLDVDLKTWFLSGTVTLDGGVLPDDPMGYRRADIAFVEVNTGDRLDVSLNATGPAAYNVELYEGTYRILIDSDDTDQTVLPKQETVAAMEFLLESDQTLNIDLRPITVTGTVTLNGGLMPDDPSGYRRGDVVFVSRRTGYRMDIPLGATGPAVYSAWVYPDSYDILVDSDDTSQVVLPVLEMRARERLEILTGSILDLDVQTVQITGTVTRNGAVLPDEPNLYRRGEITFQRLDTSDRIDWSVGAEGDGTYSAYLYAGDYAVGFDSDDTSQAVLPHQDLVLIDQRDLSADGWLDLDLEVVTASCLVTQNGGVLPDDPNLYSRGDVTFSRRGERLDMSVGGSGPGALDVELYAGVYDIGFDSNDTSQAVLPQQEIMLLRDYDLSSSRTVNLDLKVVTISGAVTLNGAQMPDDPYGYRRGDVRFRRLDTGYFLDIPIEATGPATYTTGLYAGKYNLEFDSNDTDQTVLPYLETFVRGGLDIQTNSVLDFDLQAYTVTGTVTKNGAPMPDDPYGYVRGDIRFVYKLNGSIFDAGFGAAGAAVYSAYLYSGGYDLRVDSNDTDQTVLPDLEMPLMKGCVTGDTGCTTSPDDLTGSWVVMFDYWTGTMTMDLVQNGNTLSGYASVWWGSGPISGTRSGNSVEFSVAGAIRTDYIGEVINGCTMFGTGDSSTGTSTGWVAFRTQ